MLSERLITILDEQMLVKLLPIAVRVLVFLVNAGIIIAGRSVATLVNIPSSCNSPITSS